MFSILAQIVVEQPAKAQAVTDVLLNNPQDKINKVISVWDRFNALLLNPNNLMVAFLFLLGSFLRWLPKDKFRNELIPVTIPAVGGLLGMGWFSVLQHRTDIISGFMLGVVYGCITIAAHNVIKQFVESPTGIDWIQKDGIRGMILAMLGSLVGANITTVLPKDPPK